MVVHITSRGAVVLLPNKQWKIRAAFFCNGKIENVYQVITMRLSFGGFGTDCVRAPTLNFDVMPAVSEALGRGNISATSSVF